MSLKAKIIGYDSGWGCQNYGCEDGPTSISSDLILQSLSELNVKTKLEKTLGLKNLGKHSELNTKEKTLPLIIEGLKRLSNKTKQSIENKEIPIVIGGDHTSAIGTWSGVVNGLKSHQKFGLIWLDAHLDAHTNKTSHEGKWGGWWHGQPVSAITGHGLPCFTRLCDINPKLSPQHISMIGIHSFEPAEEAFVRKQGIRVYYLDEVKKRGFKEVYEESLKRALNGTEGFGLSIDLDAFDPKYSPGVGTREHTGLNPQEVLPSLKSVARHPLFKALEIAEFNPHNDENNKTHNLIKNIIKTTFYPS